MRCRCRPGQSLLIDQLTSEDDVRALVAVGVLLIAAGLVLWWAAPNMAAPLVGLTVATVGFVLVVAGVVIGQRCGTRSP